MKETDCCRGGQLLAGRRWSFTRSLSRRDEPAGADKAGASLHEIVDSIKDVAAIVAEIAAASSEQASGIDQINKALSQMDEATQQNSALVEENAATAKTLEDQQLAMSEQVGFFRFAPAAGQVAKRPGVVTALKRPAGRAVRRGGAAVAAAADQEWQEF